MPTATTPAQRVARMLREGARLILVPPGQVGIDLTPDILALLGSPPGQRQGPPDIRIRVRRPPPPPQAPCEGPIDLTKLGHRAAPCAKTHQESS